MIAFSLHSFDLNASLKHFSENQNDLHVTKFIYFIKKAFGWSKLLCFMMMEICLFLMSYMVRSLSRNQKSLGIVFLKVKDFIFIYSSSAHSSFFGECSLELLFDELLSWKFCCQINRVRLFVLVCTSFGVEVSLRNMHLHIKKLVFWPN